MGNRRHGKPDRFGEGGGFSTEETAVDAAALADAIERFVATFVIASKRDRVRAALHGRPERRVEALQQLPYSIAPALQTELDGASGFPQHLAARFGALRGVLIDGETARGMTIGGATWTAAMTSGVGALFIADDGSLALLLAEVGPPTLCRRDARK